MGIRTGQQSNEDKLQGHTLGGEISFWIRNTNMRQNCHFATEFIDSSAELIKFVISVVRRENNCELRF